MELSTLQAQILAARQVSCALDGVNFALELPSDHVWRITLEANRDEMGRLLHSQAAHAVLSRAITGWEGLTARHLLPSAPADPVAFSPAARGVLLEIRQDLADDLFAEIGAKVVERRVQRETARKN